MDVYWTLVADRAKARIFRSVGAHSTALEEIEDYANEEARSRIDTLKTDHQGRFYGRGDAPRSHQAAQQVDPQDAASIAFAKLLAEVLEHGLDDGRYERLRIVAAPQFLGQLRSALPQRVKAAITEEFDRDIAWMSVADIEHHMKALTALS